MSANAYHYRDTFEPEKGLGDQQPLLPAQHAMQMPDCTHGCAHLLERQAKIRRRRRRVIHFLALSLVACLVGFHIFKGGRFSDIGRFMRHDPHDDEPISFPIPADVTLGECALWEEGPARWGHLTSTTSFELPLSSENLFLLSRGLAAGALRVEATEEESDAATVDITAEYKYEDSLDWVKVCQIEKGEGEKGIGFFGPRYIHHPHHGVHLKVVLSLPRGGADKVLNVKNFETDLSLFAHHIENLVGKVTFENIKLRSENVPIGVDGLYAEHADVATINSPVEGHFEVTDSLVIHTANSPIKVEVKMYNSDNNETTSLNLKTSNGPIKSYISLVSTSEDETGGKFVVDANTSTSPIDVIFEDAPVNSALTLDAHTSLGPVNAKLPAAYEGTFEASTSLSRPSVQFDNSVEDPAGKGRKRHILNSQAGSTVKGVTFWDEEGKDRGSVKVKTSLAGVTLVF